MEKFQIAKQLDGIHAQNGLDWLGSFSYEFKRRRYQVAFHKKAKAAAALAKAAQMGLETDGKIHNTPRFVNTYFKFSICIFED